MAEVSVFAGMTGKNRHFRDLSQQLLSGVVAERTLPEMQTNNVQNSDIHRLAETLRAKINKLYEVLNVMKTAPKNKRCESYPLYYLSL